MSLALDIGLFFRNSKTKLGLSTSARYIALVLAFRIGQNNSTWISPTSLADECGIARQNIFAPLKKLIECGLLKSKTSKRHKQKSVYLFNNILNNYSQMSQEEKKIIHESLDDSYTESIPCSKNKRQKMLVDKSKNQSGKPDSNNKNQSGKPDSISGKKIAGSPAAVRLQENEKSPKETLKQRNICNQNNRAKNGSVFLQPYPEDFCPNDDGYLELEKHARRTNCSYKELLDKFKVVMVAYKAKSNDWQKTFCEFLANERPKKAYEDMQGRKRRYDGASINY